MSGGREDHLGRAEIKNSDEETICSPKNEKEQLRWLPPPQQGCQLL